MAYSAAPLQKSGVYLPKQKHCEWFVVWMTGPRLIKALSGHAAHGFDASWEY
jgi:hypothetical protein